MRVSQGVSTQCHDLLKRYNSSVAVLSRVSTQSHDLLKRYYSSVAVLSNPTTKGYKRLSRGLKGSSRGSSKEGVQQFEDKAESSNEESSKSFRKQRDWKRAAPHKQKKAPPHNLKKAASHNLDDASESQSDDMAYNENLDAVSDDSDMDSDDDDTKIISPNDIFRGIEQESFKKLPKKEQEKATRKMMDQLISEALDGPEEAEDGPVPEDEQRSLRVGIIGAVNAGKSTLINLMVGTKVAAVSRKRNTTLSEILGIVTNGRYQILLYDTPGLVLDILGRPSKSDTRHRSESAWQLFSHCEVLLVLVDAYRQLHKVIDQVNTKHVTCPISHVWPSKSSRQPPSSAELLLPLTCMTASSGRDPVKRSAI
ncbi:hypothetical protein GOP47_0016758 [Adiantum capillus-veneris]|uniref:G domain-containing protein n=1 Tax=Adiantum capillus-veneris TaxID=13818 RepID=A0A9D4UIA4_ADICA|nr:hypothetical protein GOP47_0016758 [Adiantum capillus-veneris]